MSIVHYYPTNHRGRTFVVGDMHGCYRQFCMLLEAIAFNYDNDVMYSVSDLIDRGPDSKKCLMLTREPWFRAVQGNHEALLIESVNHHFNWGHWIKHGGGWAAKLSFGELSEMAEMAKALPMAIVVGEDNERFNVFHAEFHGDNAKLDEMGRTGRVPVWVQQGRSLIEGEVSPKHHKGLSPSFVGHSIVKRPRMIGSHVYLDTGSYFGERADPDPRGVSVIEVATQRIWQVSYGKVIETCKS